MLSDTRRRPYMLIAVAAVAILAASGSQATASDEARVAEPPCGEAPAEGTAMRIAIDPATGELTDAPVAERQSLGGLGAGSLATDPPEVRPLPGGGELLVIGDRLRHVITATAQPVGDDGIVPLPHSVCATTGKPFDR